VYLSTQGTKHSTATDLKRSLGVARAREATGHSTHKAFERYIVGDPEAPRALYPYARPDKELAKDFYPLERGKVIEIKEKLMVEAGGVEPPSESIRLRVSPYTVSVLLSTFILPETG
jgi:hypothetical protein